MQIFIPVLFLLLSVLIAMYFIWLFFIVAMLCVGDIQTREELFNKVLIIPMIVESYRKLK